MAVPYDFTEVANPIKLEEHASQHENGGDDEIDVTGLSGLLADDQHVLDAEVLAVAAALVHASRHENSGADEISVAGLSGLLADDQHFLKSELSEIVCNDNSVVCNDNQVVYNEV